MVIGKFRVSKNELYHGSTKVTLAALYDDKLDEDRRFAQATPSASVEMVITNPSANEQFKQLEAPIYCVFMNPREYEEFKEKFGD
jgi:hypothetical protein